MTKKNIKKKSIVKEIIKPKKRNNNSNNQRKTRNKEVLSPEIKKNPWNVHYTAKDIHKKIVVASKNKEALILGTTTKKTQKHSQFDLDDGIVENQTYKTLVSKRFSCIPTKKIQRKVPDSRITKRDKNKIYNSIKYNPNNINDYKNLGNLLSLEKNRKKKELNNQFTQLVIRTLCQGTRITWLRFCQHFLTSPYFKLMKCTS